jgi:ferredoxin, 2Fe-2S
MEVAIKGGINSIIAECGGACSCATCHCYVDAAWKDILPQGGIMEMDMLDFASNVRPTSRLSCQITLEESYDGLVIHTPERQG